jgi:hypothetical protein
MQILGCREVTKEAGDKIVFESTKARPSSRSKDSKN